MSAGFHNALGAKHQNTVVVLDGGQAVGNGQGGAAMGQLFQALPHKDLALVVQCTGGLVQDQDGRVLQEHPGNGDALLLATRELDTALAHIGVEAVLQGHDKAQTIIEHIEAPEGDPEKPLQVLISTIDYNEYVGRIGIGKVDNGEIAVNKECIVVNAHDPERKEKVRITKLYEFEGLDKVDVKNAQVGSIVAISGISDLSIGDTICDVDGAEAIPFQKISEPTISMQFMVNDSPLAGQEGKYVTSRHIRDRLFRELNTDVSLRVEESENQDSYKVSGRGELHLSVLIENMRREGYEFAVSKAEVLYHYDENGKKLEPMEIAVIDVPEEFTGAVIEKLSQRKGELQNMTAANGGYARHEFSIPSRGLIGYRGEFMTDTKGNGILNTLFDGYGPYKGDP